MKELDLNVYGLEKDEPDKIAINIKHKIKDLNKFKYTRSGKKFVKYFLGVIKNSKEIIQQKPIINSPSLKPNIFKPAKGLAEIINIANMPTYKIVNDE